MSQNKENVNKLFRQFNNYLNLVLENENGIETIKGGNVVFVSLKEDKK